jgi:hypothetical protein
VEEFHRRLRQYHQWAFDNRQQGERAEQRAPRQVMDNGKLQLFLIIAAAKVMDTASRRIPPSSLAGVGSGSEHRYFRVPFNRRQAGTGWWYAHFRGQHVVRQMELFGSVRPPLLLVTGTYASQQTCAYRHARTQAKTMSKCVSCHLATRV